MAIMLAALLLAGQQPAPDNAAPAAAPKKKAAQVCQMVEVTGSRARKRVCRNAAGDLDLGPGVSTTLGAKGWEQRQNLLSNSPGGPGQ